MQTEWRSFQGGAWETEVNVRDFIQKNYHPYDGDDSFLEGPTQDTTDLWDQVLELSRQEREAGGVLDMDTKIISTITSHGPGYLDKEKEKIVDMWNPYMIDFPVFNVADIYVTTAAIALIILVIFYYKDEDFEFLGSKKAKKTKA